MPDETLDQSIMAKAFVEFDVLLREATVTVEDELRLEDRGWTNLSSPTPDVILPQLRIANLKTSRLYTTRDPLAKQAIRIWTDYTFGSGMSWAVDKANTAAQKALEAFWDARVNRAVLSARGQRKSCDKLLVDGEVFFLLFLGPNEVTIRWVDPLEIVEIISDPDDIENVLYYKRSWSTPQKHGQTTYYRSWTNMKGEVALDVAQAHITGTEAADDAVMYHITYNTNTQRGNPLLLSALDWLKQYRRFLSSRVAIMLAMAKFAWKSKVQGGAAAVAAIKDTLHEADVAAGSTLIENMGADTTPIKQDTGSKAAYQDGRMLKLQVAAAVGLGEQYFGDISTGNLATAKTVELPMQKMFNSYQQVWRDWYQDISEIVLEHAKVDKSQWYVDFTFPVIAPADVQGAADAFVKVLQAMPDFVDLPEVKQAGLMILQINDPAEVLEGVEEPTESGNIDAQLARLLRQVKKSLVEAGSNGKGKGAGI